MEGESRFDSWVNMEQGGDYDGAFEFNDKVFFDYSPMVLESSCYPFERSEVDHTEPTAAFHLQGNTQKAPSSSPLGLTLRKTPSLLTMFESKLFKDEKGSRRATGENCTRKIDIPLTKTNEHSYEKLKASNFGASFLKIGKWQRVKRFEGDLVVKCYFAKKKLVWEVLEGALKSKIEIQWCDIMGIRAVTHEPDQPGILEIELSQPPMFYHESDPKPKKHTSWQPCADFTGGQALSIRRHYVTFPPGMLDRHYEKLLQCDVRLSELSQRTFPTIESPYFPSHYSDYSTFSFEPSGFMLQDSQDSSRFIIPSHSTAKQSTGVIKPSKSTFSDYQTHNHQYEPMETAQWNNNHGTFDLQTEHNPAFSSHHIEPPTSSRSIYDIEKHLLSDSQFVPFDEDTVLLKVRSMYSLLDYSTQAASNFFSNIANSNYMEAEDEYSSYSDNIQMENCSSEEFNGFAYSEDTTLGSCLQSFNEELAMNCPYY
ncbi:hypothetical protein QQ045_001710 [Rhodiola kirilowii]